MASEGSGGTGGRKEEDDAVARVAHHHGWHAYLRSLDSDEAREVTQLKRRYADTFVDLTYAQRFCMGAAGVQLTVCVCVPWSAETQTTKLPGHALRSPSHPATPTRRTTWDRRG